MIFKLLGGSGSGWALSGRVDSGFKMDTICDRDKRQ